MKFKLPKLDLLVDSSKTTNESDARKYIHVINGHAIVNNGIMVCVNIREYVKITCGVESDDDLNRLTEITDFMEGKSFTKAYWAEMSKKECSVNLIDDSTIELELETFDKRLIYENVTTEKEISLKSVADNLNRPEVVLERFAIDHRETEKISKAFAAETRNDTIIYSSCGQENCLRFQFKRKDFIFGVLPMNYDSSTELTSFLVNEELSKAINEIVNL